MTYDFSEALTAARGELDHMRLFREWVDVEIAKLEQVVASLSAITGQQAEAMQVSGITNAIRAVLKTSAAPLTPVQVRDKLKDAGYEFVERHSNLLANVHVVLKRLEQSGEAKVVDASDGKRYAWSRHVVSPPISPETMKALERHGAKITGHFRGVLDDGTPVSFELDDPPVTFKSRIRGGELKVSGIDVDDFRTGEIRDGKVRVSEPKTPRGFRPIPSKKPFVP